MKRKLTISFTRAVGSVTQSPAEIEVVLMAIGSESSSRTDLTYLPVPDRRKIRMTAPVVEVEFDVTPSDDPSFEEPIIYRMAWRRGYIGRMESHDFLMPNRDVHFEDILRLEDMDPDRNLTEADLGVPGRVARLSSDGRVQGVDGIPLYTTAQIDNFFQEAEELRQREDQGILEHVDYSLETFQSSVDSSVRTQIANAEMSIGQDITKVEQEYKDADTALRNELLAAIENGSTDIPDNLLEILESKADLENGKIKYEQLPDDIGQGNLHQITSNDRLPITQAEPGDMAVSPTDTWFLTGDYTNVNNWVRLSTLLKGVQSVNNKTGDNVFISAEDVGARPAGNVPVTDISGLTQRFAVELDGVIREDDDGKLATSYLRDDVPRLDGTRILNAAGEEIAVRGDVTSVNGLTGDVTITPETIGARKTGEAIPIGDITSLQNNLNLKVNVSDPRLTDSRTPTSHADSHKVTGSDPLVIEQSQVTNLVTALDNRATLAQFQAFRDEIYADLPDNPEQQANASREYAALSLTGAQNTTDKLEQMAIYLNETNGKYTLFEENAVDFNLQFQDFLDAKESVEGSLTSIDTMVGEVVDNRNEVRGLKVETQTEAQVALEASALSVLVAELLNYSINGGDIELPRPFIDNDSIEERHLSPALREKLDGFEIVETEPGSGLYRIVKE